MNYTGNHLRVLGLLMALAGLTVGARAQSTFASALPSLNSYSTLSSSTNSSDATNSDDAQNAC